MTEVTPQEFDLDAWLEDAERPARSVTVYKKAGLIADLDALEARILNAEDEEIDGPSAGGGSLRTQYAKLAKQFHDSALVIKIEGRTEAEKRDLLAAHEGLTGTKAGYIVIADAIQSPKFTASQLEKLADKLGEIQFNRIIARFHEVCTELPAVSADFLPSASIADDGGE